ncbi:type IV secretion system protein [Francisella philomiragia]|uniref:type IV secretion system protein n=1 Tax=Francisella philomiragia TaxID=28110 RepID=UPI0019044D9F|nr:type IV secretion system protein [Francisella philomiragia]MBK2257579.1 hypothetical protein [Francisella philomiragia]MBK2270301.1 hypothetical protein [Francisella philomiragia]MBK2272105.1 hypothetical protein [Francisella philomiragia]MBK2275944.1 hypothetical protein [Francisella philomiragia]MBK2295487.1 hypothetical protein [Francisella philomiragia]
MKKKIKALMISSALCLGINSAYAFWPVIDPASIQATVQQTAQLVKEYQVLKQTYDQIVNSNNLLGLAVEKLSGKYGLGDYLNTIDSVKYMNENPATWLSVLNGLDRNLGTYTQYADQYNKDYNFADDIDLSKIVKNSEFVKLYEKYKATGKGAYSLSSKMFDDSNTSLEKFKQLSDLIEQENKNPNTKSATDLNTRVLIELGYQMSMMNRQLATLNQMMALQISSDVYATSDTVKQIKKSQEG